MTTTQIIVPTITITVTLLIAIFRNQLASVGDKVSKHFRNILFILFTLFWFLSGFVWPTYTLITNHSKPFNQNYVDTLVFNTAALLFNLVVFSGMMFRKSLENSEHSHKEYINAVKDLMETKLKSSELELKLSQLKDRFNDALDNGKSVTKVVNEFKEYVESWQKSRE